MTATPNMNLTLPTDHGSSDTWDVILDQVFNLIDSHDHSTGKGVKVPSAALNINADVAWTGFSITGLNAVDFTPVAAGVVAGFAGALFVNSSDNELYYRTTAGSNVKFTTGAALNVAAFTGGFGGDYASVGALADFDDASDTYRFRQQVGSAVRQFGKASHADLSLFEYKASGVTPVPSNAVTLKSPAALAASYSIVWPDAVPAATQLMAMSSAGVVTAGTASAAMAANQSITVSGTGTYKHGTKTINRSLIAALCTASAGSVSNNGGGTPGISLGNNTTAYFALPEIPTYARNVNVSVWFNSASDATATTCKLYATSSATPAATGFSDLSITLTSGGTSIATATNALQTPSGSRTYWVQVSNSATTPKIMAAVLDYDAP